MILDFQILLEQLKIPNRSLSPTDACSLLFPQQPSKGIKIKI